MSAAKSLYEQFLTIGLPRIAALVGQEIETEILDCKLASSGMDDDAKKNFSEALSGFANSDGGVVIWGADCRRDPKTGVDTVIALTPIRGLKKFKSDLYSLTPQLVMPAVEGVSHESFEDRPGSESGYAISLIPRSEGMPHMATAKKLSRYMYRSGSSFMPMMPWMLADRFGRRPSAKLELVTGDQAGMCQLFIRNAGRATAKYPGFVLYFSESFRPGMYARHDIPHSITVDSSSDGLIGQANHAHVIHPRLLLQIGQIPWSRINKGAFEFEYTLYAEDTYNEGIIKL